MDSDFKIVIRVRKIQDSEVDCNDVVFYTVVKGNLLHDEIVMDQVSVTEIAVGSDKINLRYMTYETLNYVVANLDVSICV